VISILSSPKRFDGPFKSIQERALANWGQTQDGVEIILYGDSPGTAEAARLYGALHVPEVRCSDSRVPYFNAIVEHATRSARFDRQVYLNADILLPPGFVEMVTNLSLERFLAVGQRVDLAEGVEFAPRAGDWIPRLRSLALSGGASLHPPVGSDYFGFCRGLWDGLPPLVIGRGGYDNALIAHAFRRRIPVVDASRNVLVVHQWHDYSHVQGAFAAAHHGVDAQANRRLHGTCHGAPTIVDADFELGEEGTLEENRSTGRLRRLEVRLRYYHNWQMLGYAFRAMWRIFGGATNEVRRRSLLALR